MSLQEALQATVSGTVAFDDLTRGLYATDASIYQIMPVGVVKPSSEADVIAIISACRDAGVSVTARGGGTSQCGQTVGSGVIVDCSPGMKRILAFDQDRRTVRVEPGVVLDELNRFLKPFGLFFPVDPSTSSRCTIGGMTANNSSGTHSIKYGMMVENVRAIRAVLASGEIVEFGSGGGEGIDAMTALATKLLTLQKLNATEIAKRIPKTRRHVGGYNLHMVGAKGWNPASILVGSEGTLAFFTEIELALQPIPKYKVSGVCHFPSLQAAMESTQHLVTLGPSAVELVDHTMLELARKSDLFAGIVAKHVQADADCILIVEFAGDVESDVLAGLDALDARMSELGYVGRVNRLLDGRSQGDMGVVRSAGLNIMMSRRESAKPVSVIEDCAVPLEHLADYTARLTKIFERHGTYGTWYAHASEGCLHVRPVLDMKTDADVVKLRAIAEEAFEIVREYGGTHSGEHGDGIVRSEFHLEMLGEQLVGAFEEIKDAFDPAGILNPGKIVRAPKMDDRSLFRYGKDYQTIDLVPVLDWSAEGGFLAASEQCNNNGACRNTAPAGTMCPSYLATEDEQHVVRGRANALRLAMTGQLGRDAITSPAMYEAMDLCVGCKGCKSDCPTGVDMAKMKTEFLYHFRKKNGLRLKDRLVANLPRLAPFASRFPFLANLRDAIPGLAKLTESVSGMTSKRTLPAWRSDVFKERDHTNTLPSSGKEVVLLVDTFNRYYEPEIARDAVRVLEAAGYTVRFPNMAGKRPLCCGRTYLAAGLVDDARNEAQRMIDALAEFVERGLPIIGLEPSCLLTLRDEFLSMIPGEQTKKLAARAMLLEEFIAREIDAGTWSIGLRPLSGSGEIYLHGHCHQKAFQAMPAVEKTLRAIPGVNVKTIKTSCCGMAGTFGYETDHYDVSMKMAERTLLPAVRSMPEGALLVTDGLSCRHQIEHGTEVRGEHVATVLASALPVLA